MRNPWLLSVLGSTLLTVLAGCTSTAEEQVGALTRDFLLQAMAAFLF